MSALTIDAAHITDNALGDLVLPTPRRATRTSALAGHNGDLLTLGLTMTSLVRDDEFVARAQTN